MAGTIRIGISGWSYPGWRGGFYPRGLAAKDELAYAARRFNSIEINATHYRLQRPDTFARWRDATPDDFVFAVKGSRYITHMRQLRDAETALANFFAQGVLRLGPKLGPILWQFPPHTIFDWEKLDRFLAALPRDVAAAKRLARRHDQQLKGRVWLTADVDMPLRHAVEIRHDSFRAAAFIELLRRHRVGLVVADTVAWPLLTDLTSDFVYCRLHGSTRLYASGYGPRALDRWAGRLRDWAAGRDPAAGPHVKAPLTARRSGRDVYVYFDNDAEGRAPADAAALAARLSGTRSPGPAARRRSG